MNRILMESHLASPCQGDPVQGRQENQCADNGDAESLIGFIFISAQGGQDDFFF